MAIYEPGHIIDAFVASELADTTTTRGRILEELIGYLFGECSGVRHYDNNMLNAPRSGEIDVCFWNNRNKDSLDFLPEILVAECKNTDARVGSAELRVFLSKLSEMRLKHGIFVAAHGITGDAADLRSAHDVVRTAFQRDDIRILVLNRCEIERLESTDDLIHLLQNKMLTVTMQAKSFTA